MFYVDLPTTFIAFFLFLFNKAVRNKLSTNSNMAIENDIFQKSFKSLHQKALINIVYTHNWVSQKLKDIFEKGDITAQQFNILRILRGAGKPLSTLEIRKRMIDKMSDTSRIVDRLVKKELVEKSTCTSDKRLVDVTISDNGRDRLRELDKYEAKIHSITKKLTEQEARELNRLLDKIREKDEDNTKL